MPTGFHPNPHFFSAPLELAVELLRFLAVPQFPFVQFPRVRIDKRNLLEARVIVTTYNDHVRLLSPEPWLVSATKVYSGMGADIVMESLHSRSGSERNRLVTTVMPFRFGTNRTRPFFKECCCLLAEKLLSPPSALLPRLPFLHRRERFTY